MVVARVHRWMCFAIGVVAFGLVATRVTPSSYGVALAALGAPKAGLLAFAPRPVRSDEWAVITPAIQATVRNGFARYNETSFYHEDLRQIYALPVHDWGFVFRPAMWLFGVTPPNVAFSAYHVITQVMFVVGLAFLFRESGLVGIKAWLLSACIFFSGFVQYFWTAVGPVVAWWPWLTLAIIAVRRSWLWVPVVVYVFTCWSLSFFYPPLLISLGFATVCVVFGFRHNRLPPMRLLVCGLACVAGAAIAVFYLRDTLLALNDTYYPGQRRVGGGGVWIERIVSMFLPFSYINKGEPYGLRAALPPTNICEMGVVGSVYFLFALIVLEPRKAFASSFRRRRIELAVLGAGLCLTFAWMLIPIPARVGSVLLWDRVPPSRMVMASGVLIALLSMFVFRHLSTRLTLTRVALALGAIATFAILKSSHGHVSFRLVGRDLLPAFGIVVVFALRRRLSAGAEHTALLGVAAAMNVFCFAGFNPLQRADEIFDPPASDELRYFAQQAVAQHGRPLLDSFPGRVLNGLGYMAISHVEATPQMSLWRALLPKVPEDQLQAVFNRYAHIILSEDDELVSPQADVALLPRRLVMPRVESALSCEPSAQSYGRWARVETRVADSNVYATVTGTVPAAGIFRDQSFRLVGLAVLSGKVDVNLAPSRKVDDHRDEHNFVLTLTLDPSASDSLALECILFIDERDGSVIALSDPANPMSCAPCVAP